MPGVFDFLNTPEGQDKFSIMAGNLGRIFGQGSPGLEQAGKFGADLGYSGRLDANAQKQQEFWKQLLGAVTGPDQPGLTGIKNTGKGLQLDLTPGGEDEFSLGTLVNDMSRAEAVPSAGGGGATAPFPQAPSPADSTSEATSAELLPSIDISQMLSALAGSPGGSVDWLTPEMAIQVMGQNIQNRQLANQFTTALRGQELSREKARADIATREKRIDAIDADKIRVSVSDSGELIPDPQGGGFATQNEIASSKRQTQQYQETQTAAREQQIRNQAARFLGASDFAGLDANAQSLAVDMTTKAQKFWDNKETYNYASFDEALRDAFYQVKGSADILANVPTAEKTFKVPGIGGPSTLKPEVRAQAVGMVYEAVINGASAPMVRQTLLKSGYSGEDIKSIITEVRTKDQARRK